MDIQTTGDRKTPLRHFFFEPWRSDRARANVLLLISFIFGITSATLVLILIPEEPAPITHTITALLLLIILAALGFLWRTSYTVKNIRGADIAHASKITYHEALSLACKIPLETMVAFGKINERTSKLLIEEDEKIVEKHPIASKLAILSQKSEKHDEAVSKLKEEIPEPTDAVLVMTIGNGTFGDTRVKDSYDSLAEFMKDRKSWHAFSVVVLEKTPSVSAMAPNVIDILTLLSVFPSPTTRVVVMGTDKVEIEDIVSFLNASDDFLVYDETREILLDPVFSGNTDHLVPTSRLYQERAEDGKSWSQREKWIWEGEFPESFAEKVEEHKLFSASVMLGDFIVPQKGERIDPILALDLLTFGMVDVPPTLKGKEPTRKHPIVSRVFIFDFIDFDKELNERVAGAMSFEKQAKDIALIWKNTLGDMGLDVKFLATGDETEEEDFDYRSSYGTQLEMLAELSGVRSHIEAYYAGVPVEDIIA